MFTSRATGRDECSIKELQGEDVQHEEQPSFACSSTGCGFRLRVTVEPLLPFSPVLKRRSVLQSPLCPTAAKETEHTQHPTPQLGDVIQKSGDSDHHKQVEEKPVELRSDIRCLSL